MDYTGNKFASISRIVDGWNYIERKYSIWKKYSFVYSYFPIKHSFVSFNILSKYIYIIKDLLYKIFRSC